MTSWPQYGGLGYGKHRAAGAALHSGASQAAVNTTTAAFRSALLQSAQAAREARAAAAATLKNTSIEVGEITGWRCWRYRSGILWAASVEVPWLPQEIMEAKEVRVEWGPGVHAFKDTDRMMYEYWCERENKPLVFGRVSMWGEVVEYDYGYKARYATPVSLDFHNGCLGHETMNCLRTLYGLPTKDLTTIADHPAASWRERLAAGVAKLLGV